MQELIAAVQALAGQWPVTVLDARTGICRLSLPENLHYDAAAEVLLRALDDGLLGLIETAAKRLRAIGWRFAGGPWTGPLSAYQLVSTSNSEQRSVRKLPWDTKTQHNLAIRQSKVRRDTLTPAESKHSQHGLELLAARAAKKSLKLRSTIWVGSHAAYMYETKDGKLLTLTATQFAGFKGPAQHLRALAKEGAAIDPGYVLLWTPWKGRGAKYSWRTASGDVREATIGDLKRLSLRIQFAPAEDQANLDLDKTRLVFIWTLPDASSIHSTWPIFDAALNAVLGDAKDKRPQFSQLGFSQRVREMVCALSGPQQGLAGTMPAELSPR